MDRLLFTLHILHVTQRLSPIFEIAEWTQVLWVELIKHLTVVSG